MGGAGISRRKEPAMHLDKFDMIELMILNGSISLERAEELIKAHPDTVESIWLGPEGDELVGAFGYWD